MYPLYVTFIWNNDHWINSLEGGIREEEKKSPLNKPRPCLWFIVTQRSMGRNEYCKSGHSSIFTSLKHLMVLLRCNLIIANFSVLQYAVSVRAQSSLAPLSRFRGSRFTTAHAHQCCIFQSYAKTVPSRMKLTMNLTMREPTFLGSMTTDHVITPTACDVRL